MFILVRRVEFNDSSAATVPVGVFDTESEAEQARAAQIEMFGDFLNMRLCRVVALNGSENRVELSATAKQFLSALGISGLNWNIFEAQTQGRILLAHELPRGTIKPS